MNIFARLTSVFILVFLIVGFFACSPTPEPPVDPPTEQEKVVAVLTSGTGSWAASGTGITVGLDDVTEELFADFSIKFAANTFTTTGTTPVWKRQDTWSFKDETATVMLRGQDNKEIGITVVSPSQIKLTLTWDQTTYEGGRKKSIPGTYVFTLNK